MTLENEIEMYDKAKTSEDSGEIELWDRVIFPYIIRKRELEIIFDVISSKKPRRILDLGCGGGWLSKVLSSNGYQVIGIEISSKLVKVAKNVAPESEGFLIGDCMNLCTKNSSFDLIISMGVLHHLDLDKTLIECHRVLSKNGSILIMEPNAFNPIMAIGRKLVSVDVCTKDEKPILPSTFRSGTVKCSLEILTVQYLFPFSFGFAYLSGKMKIKMFQNFIKIMLPAIEGSEKLIEKIPFISKMGNLIVVVGKKRE